jgi:hypothetical protein
MTKHKSEDLKILAVKYYLKNKNRITYKHVCNIFKCSPRSLKRWIDRYTKEKSIKRHNRKSISYKVRQKHVKYILKKIKGKQTIIMSELLKDVKKKFSDFNVTRKWLGQIIRDNNITRKRSRLSHFPKTRYGVPISYKEEMKKYFKIVDKYSINNIISIDETSVKPAMIKEYSRCKLGKRCITKTSDNIVFTKYTLLVAISSKGIIGYKLYKKGGMNGERFAEFLNEFIVGKYKKKLIIMDNAGAHKKQIVKDTILNSGNKFIYNVPYNPKSNPV